MFKKLSGYSNVNPTYRYRFKWLLRIELFFQFIEGCQISGLTAKG